MTDCFFREASAAIWSCVPVSGTGLLPPNSRGVVHHFIFINT